MAGITAEFYCFKHKCHFRYKVENASYTEEILPRVCHKKSLTNSQESSSVPEHASIFVLAV